MRVIGITANRPEKMSKALSSVGQSTISINPSKNAVLEYIIQSKNLWEELSEHEVDVLLVNGGGAVCAIALVFAWFFDTKVVARIPGYYSQQRAILRTHKGSKIISRHSISRIFNRFVLGRVDGYLTVSQDLKESIIDSFGCECSRVKTVPVPLNTKYINNAQRMPRGGKDQQINITTVTNLEYREKADGVKTILDQIAGILVNYPESNFHIAGSGKYITEVRDYVEEITANGELNDKIHIHGFVENIESLYQKTDVFVYVSYLDGYPNVVIEAQSFAIPVISNDAFGMREQIEDGETGYLVTESELERKIEHLLNNPLRRTQMGSNAERTTRNRNNHVAVGEKMIRAIENVLYQ